MIIIKMISPIILMWENCGTIFFFSDETDTCKLPDPKSNHIYIEVAKSFDWMASKITCGIIRNENQG